MGWIDTIANGIKTTFEAVRKPLQTIPPLLLLCELYQRPGLSAIALTSAIISRLPEAGIETGVNPDGSANMINAFVRIIAEETVKEIKDNAKITCVIEPGKIIGTGTGANAGGPIVVQTLNTVICSVFGLIE